MIYQKIGKMLNQVQHDTSYKVSIVGWGLYPTEHK